MTQGNACVRSLRHNTAPSAEYDPYGPDRSCASTTEDAFPPPSNKGRGKNNHTYHDSLHLKRFLSFFFFGTSLSLYPPLLADRVLVVVVVVLSVPDYDCEFSVACHVVSSTPIGWSIVYSVQMAMSRPCASISCCFLFFFLVLFFSAGSCKCIPYGDNDGDVYIYTYHICVCTVCACGGFPAPPPGWARQPCSPSFFLFSNGSQTRTDGTCGRTGSDQEDSRCKAPAAETSASLSSRPGRWGQEAYSTVGGYFLSCVGHGEWYLGVVKQGSVVCDARKARMATGFLLCPFFFLLLFLVHFSSLFFLINLVVHKGIKKDRKRFSLE